MKAISDGTISLYFAKYYLSRIQFILEVHFTPLLLKHPNGIFRLPLNTLKTVETLRHIN